MVAGDEEEVDDEEMGVAETYADYMPSKCKLGKNMFSYYFTFGHFVFL